MLKNLLSIRPMQNADLEQVTAIDQASFSMSWPKSAFTFELNENPLSMLWVAEIQEPDHRKRIVGIIVIWLILDEAHIATLAVHPHNRRQGIAQELISTALEAAIEKGMQQATLEVRASNIAAQELYHRFNFEIVGQRHRYYQDNGEDAIIMTAHHLNSEYLKWLRSNDWRKARKVAPT